MGSQNNQSIQIKVLLNGNPVMDQAGSDVKDGIVEVNQHALYSLLSFKAGTDGIIELISAAPGLEIYTFTFGTATSSVTQTALTIYPR